MANLNFICGIPASGKDTWLKNYKSNDYIVSRDAIRYSIIKDNEEYFSHEKEVYVKFIQMIDYYGAIGDRDVWVNQTNVTPRSRQKVLAWVQQSFFNEINAYYIDCPLNIALERNALRTGREKVPDKTLMGFHARYSFPIVEEGFNHVYEI